MSSDLNGGPVLYNPTFSRNLASNLQTLGSGISQEEAANKPPPPTREELLKAAKERHDATLKLLESAALDDIELCAAQAKAKQQYLRELDEAMK